MRTNRKAIILLMAFFTAKGVDAQTDGLGTWNIVNARAHFNDTWSVWTELQTRSYRMYDDFFYSEIKAGFQYNINKTASVLFGVGNFDTYSPGGNFKRPMTNDEIRMWEQFSLVNNIGRLKLEHRYRLEQRWTTAGFRNRFRYRLNAVFPIGREKMAPKTFYLTSFDEIFLTDRQPHFERNRFFGGAGYEFTNAFTLQCGILYQYDMRSNLSEFSKPYLQTSLLFNIRYLKHNREQHPGTVD